eukprot:gnl/MRDRNA2_/MRDRNA2_38608_c0_seq2.p1 gnl/MRDRNA2_/MRDRNA2_38608_c0~~gnl/MRDRNA2_/MRDRNA2_38608_c0_seq2.p1  ORF type:complete len:190 (+),score=54.95 gnl/MRDRNA2_/MRDRNA2_38608_c0_seq2:97-666(+)
MNIAARWIIFGCFYRVHAIHVGHLQQNEAEQKKLTSASHKAMIKEDPDDEWQRLIRNDDGTAEPEAADDQETTWASGVMPGRFGAGVKSKLPGREEPDEPALGSLEALNLQRRQESMSDGVSTNNIQNSLEVEVVNRPWLDLDGLFDSKKEQQSAGNGGDSMVKPDQVWKQGESGASLDNVVAPQQYLQ